MNSHNVLPQQPMPSPAPLPRVPSTTDFSNLFFKPRRTSTKRSSVSFASTEGSDNNNSENSQVLYMAPSKRRINRSLSEISNTSLRKLDGPSDTTQVLGDSKFVEDAHEELSLSIIDREIFEWQYVCRTGHPYWWSSESRYIRSKKLDPRLVHESTSRIWFGEEIREVCCARDSW